MLLEKCPLAAEITWSVVKDSEVYVEEICNLVRAICKSD
jgi:hypothetical protein